MFDTMTVTKVTGAICGSLLVYLFASWASDALYATAPAAHGDEEVAQAYSIDTGAEAATTEAAAEGPAFADVFAAADAAAGEKVFGKCKACHKLDGSDGTGPHLNGVVNRAKGSVGGFGYSDGMLAMASESWTPENLDAFLTNPKGYVAGTKMSFAGLPKVEDRANLIKYLESNP
ncbi:c-type cytochrome [Tabrizicola oligotrophica]|uniref:Cytochrome c family protein n=1 Tax=Tabrizicola oligotrophica TaxID=2710650 RepID=A0A6M0QQV7_9RHOB|nr:cytochrome c family protein [Tabrizicola oligotrophica]NEY89890.1 cytochrome c family protein [Tabrizicola oligotrophica]